MAPPSVPGGGGSQTRCAAANAPHPASRHRGSNRDGTAAGRAAHAHDLIAYNPDGSLSKPAKLVNPPSDPALKPQAKSVLAAVENCNPLPVPAQYRPYYEQWKTKTIHFDPQVAARCAPAA